MRTGLWLILLILADTGLAQSVGTLPQLPPLSGRVIDRAGLLDRATEQRIAYQLAQHEQTTTNQVVVVTLPDLQGYTIERFSIELARAWQLGTDENDNGVLLLVALDERKVRIEVGYGLEGVLTDALSSRIINEVILPAFQQANLAQGIEQGTYAILSAIQGEYIAPVRNEAFAEDGRKGLLPLLFFLFFFLVLPLLSSRGGQHHHGGVLPGLILGGALGQQGGGLGRGGLGGGFGGGLGGGFGGGGASGGW